MARSKGRKMIEVKNFSNYREVMFGNDVEKNWVQKVFNNSNPVVLELACGYAEHGIALAQLNPNKNYICIDLKGDRLFLGAQRANDLRLSNIFFLRTNIIWLANCFNTESISEIWLTFPDPQMKVDKKRLMNKNFLLLYYSLLKTNGVVCLKTDSQTNIDTLLTALSELADNYILTEQIIDLSFVPEHSANCACSRYEKKFTALGKKIQFITICKK